MHFEYYKDKAREWRWRLVARNGRIVADGAEGYKRSNSAKAAILRVRGADLRHADIRRAPK